MIDKAADSKAIIFRTSKPITQSGKRTKNWYLKLVRADDAQGWVDSVVGWYGSSHTEKQVLLSFDNQEEAINYANLHGLKFEVLQLEPSYPYKPKSYANNFTQNNFFFEENQ